MIKGKKGNHGWVVILIAVITLGLSLIPQCVADHDDNGSGKGKFKPSEAAHEQAQPSKPVSEQTQITGLAVKPPSISPKIPPISINEDSLPTEINLAAHMQAGSSKPKRWDVSGGDPTKLRITIDAANRARIIPVPNAFGETSATFTLTDQNGLTASQSVRIVINNVQDPPKITSQPVTFAKVNEQYRYQLQAEDVDDDRLEYLLDRHPAGMKIDRNSGVITWTPKEHGSQRVIVRVKDSTGLHDRQEFNIVVE